MSSKLTPEVIIILKESLDISRVKVREQSGFQKSYIEGYDVIQVANSIFGFDGWSHEITAGPDTKPIGQQKITDPAGKCQFVPGWISRAKVKIGIRLPDDEWVYHEDVGLCIPSISGKQGYTEPTPDSVETSEKGAVTDAMKRAFRVLGDQFGNSLYNKDSALSKQAKQNFIGNAKTASKNGFQTPPPTTPIPGKKCPQCGMPSKFISGEKNGKKWSGYFCTDPNSKAKGCKPVFN